MKRAFLIALLLSIAIPAAAQLRHPTSQILISGAGSVAGANGTFFHSDITVLNYRTSSQQVSFQWLPQNGAAPAPIILTINAASGIISEDFVGSILQLSGLGALVITAVDANGNLDPSGQLYATERIWTPQPGSTGTVSQTFPGIATSGLNLTAASILGQRIDSRYRTNVGIVNMDSVSRDFDVVRTTDASGTLIAATITVPAMSLQQVPLSSDASTALQILVTPHTGINPALWMAYGSSVDNVTGDSWSSLGFQAR
jgi:hypothetical protein